MNDSKKAEVLAEVGAKIGDLFEPRSIREVNWKVGGQPGHPFMIGVKHVAYASDHCGGMLGQEVLERIPCAMRGCHEPHAAHTHDTVLFLALKRNTHRQEAQALLKTVVPILEGNKIDGFVFIETAEKFRISGEEKQ